MIDDPVVEEVCARGRAVTARYHDNPAELLAALRSLAHARLVETLRVVAEPQSGYV